MYLDPARANAVSTAVFLIGIGVLFYTHFWWPGVLFLLGVEAAIQGFVRGRGWYALNGAFWFFAIGLLFVFHVGLPELFVLLGVGVLLNAFFRPPMLKPKSRVDNTLE
jgi:hypothetical protein